MKYVLSNPTAVFYWFDIALVLFIYVLSVVFFFRHLRGSMTPLLVFGLFLFPIQFSMWFLSARVQLPFMENINFFEVLYLFFLKLCIVVAIALPRR